MFKNFIDQTIIGIQTGSIYALIALGYTMVYGIVKLINFAHGDIMMLGAFITYYGVEKGYNLFIALLISVIVCTILGILIDLFAYRPLRHSPRISALITAIGVSFLLESVALILFGATPKVISTKDIPIILSSIYKVNILGFEVSYLTLFVIISTIIIMILLSLFINYHSLGKATRAVSQDTIAAKLVGIDVNKTIALTFAIGSALGAFGGVMYALMYPKIEPYMGILPGLKAFIAAVLGGIGSIPGAMLGGYILGIVETYTKAYISTTWANPIVFFILIIILLLKPNGILGKVTKEKV